MGDNLLAEQPMMTIHIFKRFLITVKIASNIELLLMIKSFQHRGQPLPKTLKKLKVS